MTKKQELNVLYNKISDLCGERTNGCFIVLYIHMPNNETERIQNPNVLDKILYVNKAYDDDLKLNSNPDIYIVDYEIHAVFKKNGM